MICIFGVAVVPDKNFKQGINFWLATKDPLAFLSLNGADLTSKVGRFVLVLTDLACALISIYWLRMSCKKGGGNKALILCLVI